MARPMICRKVSCDVTAKVSSTLLARQNSRRTLLQTKPESLRQNPLVSTQLAECCIAPAMNRKQCRCKRPFDRAPVTPDLVI